jgi:hypothetical protein
MDEIRTTAELPPQRKIQRRSGYEAYRPEVAGRKKMKKVAVQSATKKIRQ